MRVRQHKLCGVIKRLTAGAILAAASVVTVLAQSSSPTGAVERLHGALLEVMQNADDLDYDARYRQLEPIVRGSYDFPFMTRIAVGPSWSELDEAQRARLTELFAEMSIANYAARFDGFNGAQFEILGEEPAPRDNVLVESRIVPSADDPVALDYVVKEFDDGWRIIDVLLESKFSELARQRSEFAAVLRGGGTSELVATLQRKIAELAASG